MLAHDEPGTNVFRLAASYAYGIAKNHPFVDGNKPAAFLAAYVFLRRNGWKLDAAQAEVFVIMMGVASGSVPEAKLGEWFEANSVKAKRK
jgi:death-on-curing protein